MYRQVGKLNSPLRYTIRNLLGKNVTKDNSQQNTKFYSTFNKKLDISKLLVPKVSRKMARII